MRNGDAANGRNGEGTTISKAKNAARRVFRPTDQGDFNAAVAASPFRRVAVSSPAPALNAPHRLLCPL
jgi:hypothetical protein